MFDLINHINEQREFSLKTFGPGKRLEAGIDHIKKELDEIIKEPDNLEEYVDLILLSLDITHRAGFTAEEICEKIKYKFEKNKNRKWPDWKTQPYDKAITHIK